MAALALGLVLALTGGILIGRRIAAGMPVMLLGAVVADQRTPRGTRLWLQVEAFRRYLADPGSRPDAPPVGSGRTATRPGRWPSAWERAVSPSTARPGRGRCFSLDVTDVLLTGVVLSAVSPSSSSGRRCQGGGGGSW
ncbi:hypothetical protein [Streptomyces sp. NPDC006335]|uniref:hypothetical protein n=1 Tax=Streptomyces sp. NPDC006335 TaxID=3156895 RepID=UPI0033AAAC5A